MDGWIVIPNWARFQHYKDREPAWIKVYTELNSDDKWLDLTCSARGVLVTCWLEYARGRGRLQVSHMARMAGAGFKHAYLQSLNDAGFINIVASRPPALTYAGAASPHALAREVLRTSKESASSRAKAPAAASAQEQLKAAAQKYAHDWNGGGSDAFDEGLDELEHLTGAHLTPTDRYDLWDSAVNGS